MSKLLFEEVPRTSKEYVRSNKTEKTILAVMATVLFLLGFICLFLKLYLVAVFLFVFAIWLSFYVVKAFLQANQHLRVFDDKICYKNTYQRKTSKICFAPSQYKIELRQAAAKSGYTVKLIFWSLDNEKLFTYKAVSIVPSSFQAPKKQWEIDLFAVGCEVIDRQEVIKNK